MVIIVSFAAAQAEVGCVTTLITAAKETMVITTARTIRDALTR